VYTHFLYLDIPAETVAKCRSEDTARPDRPQTSADDLQKWQNAEKDMLRQLCREHSILFTSVNPEYQAQTVKLLRNSQQHDEAHKQRHVYGMLDHIIAAGEDKLKTMLVIDVDKTVAAEDAGKLFWKRIKDGTDPMNALFDSSKLGYSYTAFRKSTLLYEEVGEDEDSNKHCDKLASEIKLRTGFKQLLRKTTFKEGIGAVVVTCGIRRVWERVPENAGFSNVKVIGGSRLSDGFVVTKEVKGALVKLYNHITRCTSGRSATARSISRC